MKKKRKTVGQQAVEASKDRTKYNMQEYGQALSDGVMEQLQICIAKHINIINEPEFCVVMILADDPLIKGVLRRKFYAWPYLPSPRPRQACFLYTKLGHSIKRLWVLPDAITMSIISEMSSVKEEYASMKRWADAFYDGFKFIPNPDKTSEEKGKFINMKPTNFYNFIRKEHGISMQAESEYLNANRQKFLDAGVKDCATPISQPFDFGKVQVNNIANSKEFLS